MPTTWTMPGSHGAPLLVQAADGREAAEMCQAPSGRTEEDPRVWIAEADVESWLRDPVLRPAALAMFEAVTGQSAVAAGGLAEWDLRRWVAGELERAFRRARLVATRQRGQALGWGAGRIQGEDGPRAPAAAPAARAEPPPARRETAAEKAWIEIVLVDAGGRPVAGERCRLALPDGTVRMEKLDEKGRLRLDGIAAGTCEVTFPDRDGRDWSRARP